MQPKPKQKLEYEKCRTDDWTQGVIEEVQYEADRNTGFKDDEGNEKIVDCVRFKFKLDGYAYPHYSQWMTFSYHEKSRLMSKFLMNLVEGAKPDMPFDIDALKDMPVKIMWTNNGEYQNIDLIRPLKNKIPINRAVETRA